MVSDLFLVAWRAFPALFTFAAALVGGVGCTPTRPEAARPPQNQSVNVPALTRQQETEERQVKSGLEITVAPVPYVPKVVEKVTVTRREWSSTEQLIGGPNMAKVPVRQVTSSEARVEPPHLAFLVTINNKMPRVFHGAGTVVQFNAGGRVLPVDQRGYANLTSAIIPPQQQQQLTIVGPPLSELTAPSGIVGLFLYDVVTQQSEAGVVTEKQNYRWFFDYKLEPRQVSVPSDRVIPNGAMDPMEFNQVMMRQQMEQSGAMRPGQQQFPPDYRRQDHGAVR